MNLVQWSPFRDMEDLFSRYNLGRGFSPTDRLELLGSDVEWRPAADITENDNEYVIKADLPEVKKEDVNVALENGLLTITGERRMEKSAEGEKQHRVETFYGRFSRSFQVPDDVNDAGISATCKDGVLRVRLPKRPVEKTEAKKIAVK